ncbi:hypothetical protein IJ732_07400 [bacterium]|nr:hypothetical protein [bacterium]
MNTKLQKIITDVIYEIKTLLENSNDFPIEKLCEHGGCLILYCIKEIDDEFSMTVEVAKKNSDFSYSNFIFDGEKQTLIDALSREDTLTKVLNYTENLIKKAKPE